MKPIVYIGMAVMLGITVANANRNINRSTHIWIRVGDSAVEIDNYTILRCIPNLNTYCTYWTTTNFPFRSMQDSVFQALLNVGYFTPHDFNRRYIP